jgi:hypothetical protein
MENKEPKKLARLDQTLFPVRETSWRMVFICPGIGILIAHRRPNKLFGNRMALR